MGDDAPTPDKATIDTAETASLRHALASSLAQRRFARVLVAAFATVPRHLFLPGIAPHLAYADKALITKRDPDGMAISSSSQPTMMAIMLDQLDLQPGMRVLEIGAGTGYNAALLATLVGPGGHVTSVDIDEDTVTAARAHLAAIGIGPDRVTVVCDDGAVGYAPHAPYDRMIATIGVWDISPAWFDQLVPHGLMVVPLSFNTIQLSIALERQEEILLARSFHPCGFMRLRGAAAGPETTLALPGMEGAGIITVDTFLEPAHIVALLSSPARLVALTPAKAEVLRYLLAVAGHHVASFASIPEHPLLGYGAEGILTPEADSACWLAYISYADSVVPHMVEFGAATAALHMEALWQHWEAHGSPPISQWKIRLAPQAATPPVADYCIPKQHWQIVVAMG